MKRTLWVALFAAHLLVAQEKGNEELKLLREELSTVFTEAFHLYETGANDDEYVALLRELKRIRQEIERKEEEWRASQVAQIDEPFALWDVGETTVAQLVMEYGATDSLYIVPPELNAMKLSLFSSLPFPRASWPEMIEMILTHNGIGVKKLNPYVKQLYILKLDPSAITGVVSRPEDLSLFGPHTRLLYLLSPSPEEAKWVQAFFERFSDPKLSSIQSIGAKVALVSTRETIERLLQLYEAIWDKEKGKGVRLVPLSKLDPVEAEKVLKALFSDGANRNARQGHFASLGMDELITLVLPQGLVLIGDAETVARGEQILSDLELQCEDPQEKVIFCYACKHSAPDEIADVLQKIYLSLNDRGEGSEDLTSSSESGTPLVKPLMTQEKKRQGNFVVDPKTGSILMVLYRDELPKIKGLLKRLDVPKRMVQIDVLLVEKRIQDRRQSGINLLQIGAAASGRRDTAIEFGKDARGLLGFLLSRPKSHFPSFDLTYHFLLSQEDLQINANPSVLAVNQTQATISVVEEISINNGVVQGDAKRGNSVEKSFTRAQYGITISMTPTILLSDEQEEEQGDLPAFVSLLTDVTFETTQASVEDRPPVTRRHIENEVRIADGETVILGGLRRKAEEESREKIPFLGDLPGLGKLFGGTRATDTNTEMLIFITPHIIRSPVEDLRKLRQEACRKRAGDTPEFLERLSEAKSLERRGRFEESLKLLVDSL